MELEKHNVVAEVIDVGCIGLCYLEPLVTIIKKECLVYSMGKLHQNRL